MTTLSAIAEAVDQLAKKIDAPSGLLPTYGRSEDGARHHIEVSSDGAMHWVVVERGEELDRRTTLDRDELFYWVFQTVTFSMASDYEVTHRRPDEDSRRQLFTVQLDLLATLNPLWQVRRAASISQYLREVGLDALVPPDGA